MSDDPYVREVGRLADGQGRDVIIGVNYDTVTLQTLPDPGATVELDSVQVEELAQLIVSATWQAAWQTAVSLARAVPGAEGGTPP
jgi:hypothetical protein